MTASVQVLPLHSVSQPFTYEATPLQAATERVALQAGHRLAAIAMFAILASWALIYQGQTSPWAIVVTFIASDLGLCAALLARTVVPRHGSEAMSLFIVNLVLLALSLQTMLFTRMDLIRSVVENFFSN